ncbi:Sodium-coupled monocarboxylate transporter 1 [Mizuhopecten yessoensis]|uniref:Sodium-coupled monocarboxylate transporter 1 n=1 Tax=Mizuhopecten yessoensis TaxID=6573 RepID=A0A210QS54_MIZYE|nr:Sodium-coupled monocarboxylate transporter 1 [Mizuhopecten yessoensis]
MASLHAFVLVDYIIFGLTIAISIGIGLYYAFAGGRQKTTSEFLVGNRRMKVLPVAISLMVSFESSIMMLGVPAEVYEYGIQYVLQLVGFFVANILAINILVPLLHPLKITSAYEYLELRFKSRAVRLTGTCLGILSYTCYIGIVLFGPGVALEAGKAHGGLKAVIWTDVFQAAVMYTGMAAILIKGSIDAGGVKETWRIANENGRVNLFNFDPDPTVRHTFWNLCIGSLIRGFGFMFNQSTIQRISATPTVKDAKRMLFITAPAFSITLTCAAIEGIVVYAYYHTLGCDPLKSKQINNPNQLIPFMVMDIFKNLPGMPGLFIASLFSASLSTLSSGLSSMSALLYTDVIKPHTKPMSQFKATVIAKLAGTSHDNERNTWYSSAVWLFAWPFSYLWWEATWSREGIAKLYTISYLWLSVIGILTVFIFGAIFSLMTGPMKPEDANPIYLVSFADKVMCYLPLSWRKRLRLGVDFEQAEKFHDAAAELDEFVLKTEKEGMEVTYAEPVISPVKGNVPDVNIKLTIKDEEHVAANGDTEAHIETINEVVAKGHETEVEGIKTVKQS